MGYTLAQLKALIEGHSEVDRQERLATMVSVRTAVWAEKDDFDRALRPQTRLPPIDFERAEAFAASAFAEEPTDGNAA